jgi:hypothetical protein
MVQGSRSSQAARKGLRRDRLKLQTCRWLSCRFININDRVFKTADPRHDRYRAVSQCTELSKPARLEPRGHNQRIASGLNKMSKVFILSDGYTNLRRMSFRHSLKPILEVGIAGAQENELRSLVDQGRNACEQQIQAFCQDNRLITPRRRASGS